MEYSEREFSNLRTVGGETFRDCQFQKCTFRSCFFSYVPQGAKVDPEERCIASNMSFVDCSVVGIRFGPAIVEDVVVERLETIHEPFFLRGTAFRRVVIKGQIGRIDLRATATVLPDDDTDRAFYEANKRYYDGVEWALDISGAKARELSICGPPVDLIRYDPNTQAIVRAERIDPHWDKIVDIGKATSIPILIGDLRREQLADGVVLVTPLLADKAKRDAYLTAIRRLREIGVADMP